MRPDVLDAALAALGRTARWAWVRDEVDQTTSKDKILFTVVMYTAVLGLFVLAGGVLIRFQYRAVAFGFWVFGISFTGFLGTVNVAWEVMKFRGARRDALARERTDPSPGRQFAPGLRVSRDTKIGFVATVLGLVVLTVSFRVAALLASFF